jgi:hypothetical protein
MSLLSKPNPRIVCNFEKSFSILLVTVTTLKLKKKHALFIPMCVMHSKCSYCSPIFGLFDQTKTHMREKGYNKYKRYFNLAKPATIDKQAKIYEVCNRRPTFGLFQTVLVSSIFGVQLD